MIEIKVGEFVQKHIKKIIQACIENPTLLKNLSDVEYSKTEFGIQWKELSFLRKSSEITQQYDDRFWKKEYHIGNDSYRFFSQYGGSKQVNGKNYSEFHGEKVLNYFKKSNLLLEEFIGQDISFIVGNPNSDISNEKPINKIKHTLALNQILYGPPGTGKTYNTINRALEIIDGEVSEDRSEAKARFEELSSAGQIEFVTFHQSYGYEEFVEGIKAIPVGQNGNEDGTEMIYAVSNGIFKNIAKVAKSSAISREKRYRLNAKALNIQAELIEEDDNTYRVLSGSKMRKGEAPSFKNYNYSSLKNKVLKEGKLREESEFYILESDYTFQSLSAASSVILGRQSNGFTDWVEVVENENKVQNKQNYILIIDEINRGNISKIFGELITLIEPSKRLGAEEEIRLRLPYSGELFGVPSNLYIIGTMNTADRSIALMDTALRRRFEFVEMMPNVKLLDFEVEGVNLKELLEKINARVEYLYDRDHAIGHAYFMELNAESTLEELNAVMKNKIIPLLQEYFYDDWEKIRLILNDGFIRKTTQNAAAIFASGMDDEYIEEDKFLYSVAEEFTQESYLNLCQNR